jgi:hypothetical protein
VDRRISLIGLFDVTCPPSSQKEHHFKGEHCIGASRPSLKLPDFGHVSVVRTPMGVEFLVAAIAHVGFFLGEVLLPIPGEFIECLCCLFTIAAPANFPMERVD